jgi:carboxypeptidase family protein
MKSVRLFTFVTAVLFTTIAVCFGQSGSISGVVVKFPSGEPVAGAVVKLTDEAPSIAPPGFQLRSTTTAADGSFRFDPIDAGEYYVVANASGFLPTEYGQRSPTGVGMAFEVRDGQRANVRLAMWPTSSISGRITDADGDPVGRVQVVALRLIYTDGKPSMTVAQTVMTNDRGEYRMFWLTPGTYRVAAREWDPNTSAPGVNIGPPRRFGMSEQATAPVVLRRTTSSGTVVEETSIPIYAPSTRDLSLASAIVLTPGDSANVDIQLVDNHVPAHHVRGSVVRTNPDGPPMLLLVVPRTPAPFTTIATGIARSDGAFDIGGVPAGSYILYRQDGLAAQPIEVGDSDVDVAVAESALVKLTGHITFDRGLSADVVTPKASDLQIQMTREPDLLGAPAGGPRFNAPAADNGTINLSTIAQGDYRLAIWPLSNRDGNGPGGRRPPESFNNAYVKSIRLGDADVLADGLHLWSPTQPSLEIVVGLNGAQVDGTVADHARVPAANVTVVAIPDGANKGRRDLYRQATTDRRGHFAFEGLVPADYSFYAWDDVERGAWQTPEFMRAFEGRGRFVRLREGKNESLDLNVVSGR